MTKAVLAVAAAIALGGADASDLSQSLHATAAEYYAKIASIAPVAGRDTTFDYYQRLVDDADALGDASVPKGFAADQWQATLDEDARLDLSLTRQLLDRSYHAIGSIHGLGEAFVRASKDGTMQPVAVYVPSTYTTGHPAPLLVFLHGHAQPETHLLAPPYIAQLAEQTGSIVIAPWGRGYYDFHGSVSDIYDAVDAAMKAFTIDPRKRFLAGYSMGGFSVFEVAPVRANAWSAVMCIAGALLGSDSDHLIHTMRSTPFYVLTGSADPVIPTSYPTGTAAYLHAAGFDVSYYSQAGGVHWIATLLPILTQAWHDMHAGIIRSPPPDLGAVTLPSGPPPDALKP